MPIYEYRCSACAEEFELLIRGTTVPRCPFCQSERIDRLVSLPQVRSETTKGLAMKAAKRRDAKQAEDRVQEQARYEREHESH